MDFTKLDLEHKQSLLCTCQGLSMAIGKLAEVLGCEEGKLMAIVQQEADEVVREMSEAEINIIVMQIEQSIKGHPFARIKMT